MADYKLVYLNYRGRAELIRFIFAQTGVSYTDTRKDPEKWPELRAETQFGIVPYLEIGSVGRTISGNTSIARYLAEKYSLAGSSPLENAALSAIVEVCEDVWTKITHIHWMKDEMSKTETKRELKEKHLPVTLAKLEKQIALNTSDGGWIYSKKVTYADFAVYVLMECLVSEVPSLLADNFPGIARLMESVAKLEGIKQWIKTRPETAF